MKEGYILRHCGKNRKIYQIISLKTGDFVIFFTLVGQFPLSDIEQWQGLQKKLAKDKHNKLLSMEKRNNTIKFSLMADTTTQLFPFTMTSSCTTFFIRDFFTTSLICSLDIKRVGLIHVYNDLARKPAGKTKCQK